MIARLVLLTLIAGVSSESCDMCSCLVLSNPSTQVLYLNCSHAQMASGKPVGSMFAPRYETISKFNVSRIWATFENNAIETLQEFPPVGKVEKLSLANNNLRSIHERAFLYTKGLKELSLANNKLAELSPKMFQYLTNLENLDVSRNLLTSFPSVSMPLLQELDLKGNAIRYVNASMFGGCDQLVTLDLSRNKLKGIQLHAFPGLQHLSLSDNSLHDVGLDRAVSLVTLDLSGNRLANLNSVNFVLLKSLTRLDVSNNNLTSLPTLSTSIRQLNLGYNLFDRLGVTLTGLANLETLRLESNRLSSLQGCNMSNLQVLNVSGNALETISMSSVSKLRILDVSYNKLTAVPSQVTPILLPALEELVLDGNSMRELGIFYNSTERVFENLTSVSACHMPQLETLGGGFFRTMTLRPQGSQRHGELAEHRCNRQIRIRVAHNPALSKVHPDTLRGVNVCQLDLSYNSLRSIDSELLDWKKVHEVNLQGNPWNCDCSLQWMLDRVVPQVLLHSPRLLYDLRCETPVEVRTRRMVHFYNWTLAFCNKFEQMRAAVNLTDPSSQNGAVLTSSSNIAMIVVLSLMAVLVLLVAVGLILQRKMSARRRLRNRKF